MNDWAVYRLDYNANEFLVEKGLSKDQADALAIKYIERGHHQHYWVDKQPPMSVDYVDMLSELLRSGSSLRMSLQVLLNQGAKADQCIDALTKCTSVSLEECKKMVDDLTNDQTREF